MRKGAGRCGHVGHSSVAQEALAEARRRDAEIASREQFRVVRVKARLVDHAFDEHDAEIITRTRRKA
jgi:hypothetical protein